jgi:transketolase
MRGAIRLAALTEAPVTYVFTHDSIGVGEDGPTHEPVEHISTLRCLPNLTVIRPGDANETVEAWRIAMQRMKGPVALILSRQKLPSLDQSRYPSARNVEKGAYVLVDSEGTPDLI